MTEAEWMACPDTYLLLEFLREKASDRKLRLFAVACARRPYYAVADARHHRAVLLAEKMADETVSDGEWESVHQPALEFWRATAEALTAAQKSAPQGGSQIERLLDLDMATAAGWAILESGWEAAYQVTGVSWSDNYSDEPHHQIALLREVMGNPFRPVAFSPSWRTDTAVALARGMYGSRDFSAMPVLADALQEAGCDNDDILSHCRGADPHVRGCWVVDLVLGKQ
jgi:hypothetical protein